MKFGLYVLIDMYTDSFDKRPSSPERMEIDNYNNFSSAEAIRNCRSGGLQSAIQGGIFFNQANSALCIKIGIPLSHWSIGRRSAPHIAKKTTHTRQFRGIYLKLTRQATKKTVHICSPRCPDRLFRHNQTLASQPTSRAISLPELRLKSGIQGWLIAARSEHGRFAAYHERLGRKRRIRIALVGEKGRSFTRLPVHMQGNMLELHENSRNMMEMRRFR